MLPFWLQSIPFVVKIVSKVGIEKVIGVMEPERYWVKTGKISKGNHYFDIDWHQPREWERDGSIMIKGLDTSDMITDIGTKACTKEEFERLLLPMKGHEAWKITKPRHTMTFT